jgi:hypothetical protein
MRLSVFIFVVLFSMCSTKALSNNSSKDDPGKTEDQTMVMSPNPVNKFLEIKIKSELLIKAGASKDGLKYEVRILNQKGMMVFSTTKNIDQFSIFTGGLPEGEYDFVCKVDTLQIKKSFSVKH